LSSPFTNIADIAGTFTAVELDVGVDFIETGDGGTITITGSGYGEGGYGEGGYGGDVTIIINFPTTIWVDVETP
jgi:hypothetical protein